MELSAACTRCVGLCCVAPAFVASVDFAVDKPAGQACAHLRADHRCGIHDDLRARGFRGCAVFDCFGAGQRVTAAYPGSPRLHDIFHRARVLHELRWLLEEAISVGGPHADAVRAAIIETERIDPDGIRSVALQTHRWEVTRLVRSVSDTARSSLAGPDHRGADLTGRDLRSSDLRGADLSGSALVSADLRGSDLRLADLTGADLREADLRGADLSASLFLAQPQLDSARGDATTRIPPRRRRPAHWGPR